MYLAKSNHATIILSLKLLSLSQSKIAQEKKDPNPNETKIQYYQIDETNQKNKALTKTQHICWRHKTY